MVVVLFVAIALVMSLGVVFLTGKGLGFFYLDTPPVSDEDVEEYVQKHIDPVHMCRFIGVCILAGCVVAVLFVVGLMTQNNVFDIIAICLAIAGVIAGGIVYLILFKYRPMKQKYYEAKAKETQSDVEISKS